MTKYEQLIEYIINENEEKARELFHEIVVEKSREIYESMVDEENLDETGIENLTDEITSEEEAFAEGEDEDEGELDMSDEGSEDDMDMGDEEDHHADVGGEEELEDRVMDLETELDELQAKFDELMGQDDETDMDADMDVDADMDMGADLGDEESEDDEMNSMMETTVQEVKSSRKMTESEWIREYVEKISAPSNTEEGDGKSGPVAGDNDMGGTTDNIAQGGEEQGGKVKSPKVENAGNKNVPGAKVDLETAPKAKSGE